MIDPIKISWGIIQYLLFGGLEIQTLNYQKREILSFSSIFTQNGYQDDSIVHRFISQMGFLWMVYAAQNKWWIPMNLIENTNQIAWVFISLKSSYEIVGKSNFRHRLILIYIIFVQFNSRPQESNVCTQTPLKINYCLTKYNCVRCTYVIAIVLFNLTMYLQDHYIYLVDTPKLENMCKIIPWRCLTCATEIKLWFSKHVLSDRRVTSIAISMRILTRNHKSNNKFRNTDVGY